MATELRFDALGTRWIIELPTTPDTTLQSSITTLIAEFQSAYTRFSSDSLLGVLNDSKELRNPPKEVVDMLTYAIEMYVKSGGLFNISIGSQLEKDGYGLSPTQTTRVSKDLASDIHIAEDRIQIAEHLRLDLGGFGKGWLVERVHALLNTQGWHDHVINAGGDIRVGAEPKTIFVESPTDSTELIGSVTLQNEGFAVSSNSKRTWHTTSGAAKAHIIHPTTTQTPQSIQVCIRAKTCLLADTVATIMLLSNRADYSKVAEHFGVEYMALGANTLDMSNGFGFVQNPNSSK